MHEPAQFIKTKALLEDDSRAVKFKQLAKLVDDVFQLIPSGKRMSGRDL